jgi:short-subunit dehydrogenase
MRTAGVIVNIGSVAAYMSGAFGSHYSATKSALKSLSDGLRQELR